MNKAFMNTTTKIVPAPLLIGNFYNVATDDGTKCVLQYLGHGEWSPETDSTVNRIVSYSHSYDCREALPFFGMTDATMHTAFVEAAIPDAIDFEGAYMNNELSNWGK